MPKQKVFVTRKIPEIGIKLLKKHFQVKVYPKDKAIPRKELLNEVKRCDALLCLLTDKIDQKVLDANPNLKIIANYAVGFNNIDINYAKKVKISISNTPGKLISKAVAEHTISLMFAITKRIVEADRFTRRGKFHGWSPTLMIDLELSGKTLGILVAFINQSAIQAILYFIVRNKKFEKKYKAKYVPLKTLLKKSNVVTLHVPLLKSTHHLIGKKELTIMKKTAYLVNTSRGPVIDEKELVKSLKKKQIAGAALDVLEFEPKLSLGLADLDNVVLTPHIASATIEAREEMSTLAANNIIAALKGKKIPNRLS